MLVIGGSSSRISGSPSPRFGVALLLGAWQMFVRSPLLSWISNPEWYYRSVTAHGTAMGYVFPTLVAMGFGYAITEVGAEAAAGRRRWAWAGFWLIVAGTVTAMVPVALGRASVLYTFYPPLIGNAVLLHRRRAGRRRLLDLGRADVDQPAASGEARQSRRARAAGDVRQRGRVLSLGLDRGRRRARAAVPDHPRRARARDRRSMPDSRASSSRGRCTRSSISG